MATAGCARIAGGNKQAENNKYNAYVELINFNSGWFGKVTNIYFSQFGTEAEPDLEKAAEFTLDEKREIYGMYSDSTEDARKLLEKAPDFGEADDKMLLYCDAFDNFIKLYFQDVNDYYCDQTYKTDDFAGAKELHTQMLKSYGTLVDAEQEFLMAFSPKMLEMEGAELPELKKKGLDIHYYALKVVLDSRKIQNYFAELSYDGIDFLDADMEQYGPMYDEFVADVKELKKVAGDSAQMKKEYENGVQQTFVNRVIEFAERMEKQATNGKLMIEAGTTELGNEPSGLVTSGGRAEPMLEFERELWSMIDAYNKTI